MPEDCHSDEDNSSTDDAGGDGSGRPPEHSTGEGGPTDGDGKSDPFNLSNLNLGHLRQAAAYISKLLDGICSSDEPNGNWWLARGFMVFLGIIILPLLYVVIALTVKSNQEDIKELINQDILLYVALAVAIVASGFSFALGHKDQSYCQCAIRGVKLSISFAGVFLISRGVVI